MGQIDFNALVGKLRNNGVSSIVLMGSCARGDAGAYSDIDLVRFRDSNGPERDAETHLLNGTYPEVAESLGRDSQWVSLSRETFGIAGGLSLRGQVASGLRLYLLTVDLIGEAIEQEHKALIEEAATRIRNELGRASNKTDAGDTRQRACPQRWGDVRGGWQLLTKHRKTQDML